VEASSVTYENIVDAENIEDSESAGIFNMHLSHLIDRFNCSICSLSFFFN
jgi:hypothetical protein